MENQTNTLWKSLPSIEKLFSKKFLVWGIASISFFMGMLSPDYWFMISMMYIGAQGVVDIAQNRLTAKATKV